MRVAVIGGGVSGLVSAYLMRDHHEVVLFEKAEAVGGHTWTVDVEQDGQSWAVDTGFIVYNERTYPHFIRLLDELGIQGQATNMSFSVSDPASGIEYASDGLGGVFAQKRNLLRPEHLRMVADILRFNRESLALLTQPCGLSLEEYLQRGKYSRAFTERYLMPMCAAIWSASLADSGQFPADHFVEFFHNHGLLTVSGQPQWLVVPGGSREYVRRLTAVLGDRIRCNQQVEGVSRHADGVTVVSNGQSESFDQVILACHSDQALGMLSDASDREQDILGALPYQANDVILHTDRSLLPRTRRAWASWNYRIDTDRSRPSTLTYHMNRLQGLQAPVDFCVTLNQRDAIDPASIRGEYVYEHPVYTLAADAARQRRAEISGVSHTLYCGAYWYNGFHEDGVRSAIDVVRQLGVKA